MAAERLERQKLEQMLKDEIAERKKLQDWIRNNIGGNLEHVLAKVDNHLASSSKSQQPHMPGAVKLLPSVSKEDSKPTPISNNNNSEQPRSRASTLTKANTPSTSTNVAPKSDEKELPSSVIAASNSSQPLSAAQLILMEKVCLLDICVCDFIFIVFVLLFSLDNNLQFKLHRIQVLPN